MPDNRANRDNRKKSSRKSHVPGNATFPIAHGKKDSRGIAHPPDESVIAAKKFVEENKK